MAGWHLVGGLMALAATITPADARSAIDIEDLPGGGASAHLECVPYAREASGIRIHGNAHTWWDQAEGRYGRGNTPRLGAVMAFRPHGNSHLGHVAAISGIIDSRTVLISHANWSPIGGRRGQIEENVRAVDVSPENDWSEVRVWYAPSRSLGATHWPLYGFIYNEKADNRRQAMTQATPRNDALGDDPIGDIIAGKFR